MREEKNKKRSQAQHLQPANEREPILAAPEDVEP